MLRMRGEADLDWIASSLSGRHTNIQSVKQEARGTASG